MNINLIPKEILAREKIRKIDTIIFTFVFVLVFLGLMLYGFRYVSLKTVEQNTKRLNRDLKKLKTVVKSVEDIEFSYSQLKKRLVVINDLIEKKYKFAKFMKDFFDCIPNKLWLNSVVTKKEKDVTKIECTATAFTNYVAARFMSQLQQSGKFENVELFFIQSEPVGSVSVVRFNITCDYKS